MCPSDKEGDRPQPGRDGEFIAGKAAAILKDHNLALEKELAEYGRKYGFTERARELLARPIVD